MGVLGLGDTHGILRRPGTDILAASDRLQWSSAFAAIQNEQPYEESFSAVPSHLVILHLDGCVKVDRWMDGRHDERTIAPGGTFVVPGGMDFRVRLGGALSTVHLYIRDDVLTEVARDLCAGQSDRIALSPRIGDRDPSLERLVLTIRDELLDPGLMGDGYVDYLVRAVAARLVRTQVEPAGTTRAARPAGGSRTVSRAIDYVEANLHRTVGLEELASIVGTSVSQMIALFKRTVGTPPHRFILTLRVARACELLRSGSLPLAEIAFVCGFSHQEHMTRVFKRQMNATPGAYRRIAA